MILDVGCGSEAGNRPLLKEDVLHIDLQVTDFNKFFVDVRCDAQRLPFKNNSFDEVFCSHIIEHVKNPFLLLKELKRISKGLVTIKCPHRFSMTAKNPLHINYFNVTWFVNTLEKMKVKYNVRFDYAPRFLFLSFPRELIVKFLS